MGFLSQVANIFTGSEDAKARSRAGQVQQQAAQQAISEQIQPSVEAAQARFDPFAQVGQRGVDLAGFLGDPSQQASFLESNPLFQLGLQNLNQQTGKSAASRGRLTAGDTLTQLQNNAMLAGQPLIDRQRQDILSLLNIGGQAAGRQANIGIGGARTIADLLTGGAAAEAGGIVGAQNARSGAMGNLVDLAAQAYGSFSGVGSAGGGSAGGGNAVSQQSFINQQTQPGSGFTGFGV